jgi:hypothetical protein
MGSIDKINAQSESTFHGDSFMIRILAPLFIATFAVAAVSVAGDFSMSGPAEVDSIDEIRKIAEKDDVQGGLRNVAYVATAEYRHRETKAFVAWYNPYSGESATHVYVYIHSAEKKKWGRTLAKVYRDTPTVSVELGDAILLRDVNGKVVETVKFE